MNLVEKLSTVMRSEDDTRKFVEVIEYVGTLIELDLNAFNDSFDYEKCQEKFLDELLYNINWTLPFDYEVVNKRQILKVALRIYKLKGTQPGLEQALQLLTGIVVEIIVTPGLDWFWRLGRVGQSELGKTTLLAASDTEFEFIVRVDVSLTANQLALFHSIIDYMAPPHCRYRIIEP